MKIGTLLASIGSTEASTFGEICEALGGDCPSDREEWRDFFGLVKVAENVGFIKVERDSGKISSAILLEAGVSKIREIRKQL